MGGDVWLWEPGQDRVRCLTGARSTVTTPSHSVLLTCVPVRPLSPGGGGAVWLLVSGPAVLLSTPGVETPALYHHSLSVLQLSVNAHNLTTATFTHNDLIGNTQKLIFC